MIVKKAILIGSALFVLILLVGKNSTQEIVIPNESIRIRVIANSNSKNDQKIKNNVKKSIQTQLSEYLKDAKNIDDVRTVLKNKLKDVKYTVSKELKRNNSNTDFDVKYGYNYFPKKVYKGVNYEEGYYESIVIELGKSEGNNWWCVLFPPLCLIDEDESDNIEEVEYKSFVKEIIDKFF